MIDGVREETSTCRGLSVMLNEPECPAESEEGATNHYQHVEKRSLLQPYKVNSSSLDIFSCFLLPCVCAPSLPCAVGRTQESEGAHTHTLVCELWFCEFLSVLVDIHKTGECAQLMLPFN